MCTSLQTGSASHQQFISKLGSLRHLEGLCITTNASLWSPSQAFLWISAICSLSSLKRLSLPTELSAAFLAPASGTSILAQLRDLKFEMSAAWQHDIDLSCLLPLRNLTSLHFTANSTMYESTSQNAAALVYIPDTRHILPYVTAFKYSNASQTLEPYSHAIRYLMLLKKVLQAPCSCSQSDIAFLHSAPLHVTCKY